MIRDFTIMTYCIGCIDLEEKNTGYDEDHTHCCPCSKIILEDNGNMNDEAFSPYLCIECYEELA